ncbi:MAG: DUF5060 domain-containing protein [Saprospiraceae bacterium]|nr:DUF5060 domain-containing protein [Saprospiraceae bacterium]
MKRNTNLPSCLLALAVVASLLISCTSTEIPQFEVKKWEKLTLSFEGPETSEEASDNPFLNYRLLVSFTKGDRSLVLPGFYAADGNAAESSGTSGGVWQVRFRPDEEGEWEYEASFRMGKDIAISDDPTEGEPLSFDGERGSIKVTSPAAGEEGRLVVGSDQYLHYQDSKRIFLKGGAGSPENFLAFLDFDGTERGELPEQRDGEATAKDGLHSYAPHIKDWKEGDPSWQEGKGKGMIGALNYLADKEMNVVYFLTMNIGGDGKDVWPYTGYEERFRFDCSKLDQWEIVFDHMDKLGLMIHMVTQETENETLLDEGDTEIQRKLYYRELIARFAHHLKVTWNLGEENGPAPWTPDGQSNEQRKAMATYLKTHDPYQNYLVIHTHSQQHEKDELFDPLLGFPYLDGMSMQIANRSTSYQDTRDWLAKSAQTDKPWIITIDEIGHHSRGVDPDDRSDNNQDSVRAEVLWGNLMAGGGGVDWYFGWRNHNNDLQCEDWRSRDRVWDFTRHALHFFNTHLQVAQLEPQDALTQGDQNYCLAAVGQTYAVYLPFGGTVSLDLSDQVGTYEVAWYDPRSGGELQKGMLATVEGGGLVSLGTAPSEQDQDWAILVSKN